MSHARGKLRWIAVARVTATVGADSYILLFLSNASDGSFTAGQQPTKPFPRSRLRLLNQTQDIFEWVSMFNLQYRRHEIRNPPKSPKTTGKGEVYRIDYIIAWKEEEGGPKFLVKWTGYPFKDCQWVIRYVFICSAGKCGLNFIIVYFMHTERI